MSKLAAFPKAYIRQLCDGTMTLREWVELAAPLKLDGLEYYSGFAELADAAKWAAVRRVVEAHGMVIPMLCCSPDFSQPDPTLREAEIEKEKNWIRMAATLGARYCRVLSGQRRPALTKDQGLDIVVANIEACLPEAEKCGVTLILENHYKDDFWEFPEFAQKMDVFCELVDRIHHPRFGVNYDPSNAFLAGDDPLELLRRVKGRVVTMHASDRFLIEGTLDDLRREENGAQGYAKRLRHGEIGKGLNDYDAIFRELRSVGFDGWISIEDGVDGMEQLAASVSFLRTKVRQYW
ncbi:MAG: myo-inositol catabolism protein IolH [Verrucomicrobia bacterium]|nr:myo-inositol catabolism protein IolH [Verrucomicrobiota bacterium]